MYTPWLYFTSLLEKSSHTEPKTIEKCKVIGHPFRFTLLIGGVFTVTKPTNLERDELYLQTRWKCMNKSVC